jgi:hypothetical protein
LLMVAADMRQRANREALAEIPAPAEQKERSAQAVDEVQIASAPRSEERTYSEEQPVRREQQNAIKIGILVALLLALVPPWHFTVRGTDQSCGYSFIAVAPNIIGGNIGCSIDLARLFIEWAIVAGAAAFYALFRR